MNHLRELRRKHKLSQQALAGLLGVNQTAVSQWERGVTTSSARLLFRLCEILNTTSDYLLGISDQKEICSYSDNEIREAIHANLDTLCKNISVAASKGDDQVQKLAFEIMVELLHVLKNKDNALQVSMLTILQASFSISTRFADICTSSDAEEFEKERIAKVRATAVSAYSDALTDLQNALLR